MAWIRNTFHVYPAGMEDIAKTMEARFALLMDPKSPDPMHDYLNLGVWGRIGEWGLRVAEARLAFDEAIQDMNCATTDSSARQRCIIGVKFSHDPKGYTKQLQTREWICHIWRDALKYHGPSTVALPMLAIWPPTVSGPSLFNAPSRASVSGVAPATPAPPSPMSLLEPLGPYRA